MAINEPTKLDNGNIAPDEKKPFESKDTLTQPIQDNKEAPSPEKKDVEPAPLTDKGNTEDINKNDELPGQPAAVKDGGDKAPADDTLLSHIVSGVKEAIPVKQAAAQEKKETVENPKLTDTKDSQPVKPLNAEKSEKPEIEPPKPEKKEPPAKSEKAKQAADVGGTTAPAKKEAPKIEDLPPALIDASRKGKAEKIVYINLTELHPFNTFRQHPYGVRDDAEMKDTVNSVKEHGVQHPAIVRPRESGGFEIISGHRRHKASELAGYINMPCVVREMSDYDAVQLMKHTNKQRNETLPSEKARLLDLELEAIKHQGVRDTAGKDVPNKDAGKLSVEIVAENNNMNAKTVQRYIRLTELVPDMLKMVDEKKLGFTSAVELSYIKPKNQNLIVVSIDSEQSSPSLSQAQRMRDLDQKGLLNGDMIDGILSEQKKEEIRVIISGTELEKYFGKDKTPQDMKDQIIKLLDEWRGKQPLELAKPDKKLDKAI